MTEHAAAWAAAVERSRRAADADEAGGGPDAREAHENAAEAWALAALTAQRARLPDIAQEAKERGARHRAAAR